MRRTSNALTVEIMPNCPSCGTQIVEGGVFCSKCGARVDAQGVPRPAGSALSGIWYQNFYRIRKKVIAIANQYWIEDAQGRQLGFSRQKIIRIKENIRIFTDDSMTSEIFRIQQEQIMDMWGTFAVLDSATNACVGKLRRQAISSGVFVDEYLLLDANGQMVGRVAERGGRGLARKYLPGGSLVPEQLVVEFHGQQVAEIKQQFKIIGDIWEVDCSRIPPQFDRRTLISAMLLMGMIERDRK
ncbi:MAG TPA: zinc ribbon domain-containing protein [Thermoplasmata archaeon]|jgi:ribosomal protein L32